MDTHTSVNKNKKGTPVPTHQPQQHTNTHSNQKGVKKGNEAKPSGLNSAPQMGNDFPVPTSKKPGTVKKLVNSVSSLPEKVFGKKDKGSHTNNNNNSIVSKPIEGLSHIVEETKKEQPDNEPGILSTVGHALASVPGKIADKITGKEEPPINNNNNNNNNNLRESSSNESILSLLSGEWFNIADQVDNQFFGNRITPEQVNNIKTGMGKVTNFINKTAVPAIKEAQNASLDPEKQSTVAPYILDNILAKNTQKVIKYLTGIQKLNNKEVPSTFNASKINPEAALRTLANDVLPTDTKLANKLLKHLLSKTVEHVFPLSENNNLIKSLKVKADAAKNPKLTNLANRLINVVEKGNFFSNYLNPGELNNLNQILSSISNLIKTDLVPNDIIKGLDDKTITKEEKQNRKAQAKILDGYLADSLYDVLKAGLGISGLVDNLNKGKKEGITLSFKPSKINLNGVFEGINKIVPQSKEPSKINLNGVVEGINKIAPQSKELASKLIRDLLPLLVKSIFRPSDALMKAALPSNNNKH